MYAVGWGGPLMAIGDVTGDTMVELFVTHPVANRWEDEEEVYEGIYNRHPAVFTLKRNDWDLAWNLEHIEAAWHGVSGAENYYSELWPSSVVIVDVDGDGVREVVVGTSRHRAQPALGALYVFQWNGETFQAEYTDYCMGGVYRIDLLGPNEQGHPRLLLSTTDRISQWWRRPGGWDLPDEFCPHVPKDPEAPTQGLYTFEWNGSSFQSTEILSDNMHTLLVGQTPAFSGTQVFRFPISSGCPGPCVSRDGYVLTIPDLRRIPVEEIVDLEEPIHQLELADLDGDRRPELVSLFYKARQRGAPYYKETNGLAGYEWDGNHFAPVWQAEADPLRRTVDGIVVGDLDEDGWDEIVNVYGVIYRWRGDGLIVDPGLYEGIHRVAAMGDRFYEMAILEEHVRETKFWFVAQRPSWGVGFIDWPYYLYAATVH